jgi:hypothetical protein
MAEHLSDVAVASRRFRSFLAAGCLYLLFVQMMLIAFGISRLSDGNLDFRHLYTAGYLVRTGQGHDIYNYEVAKRVQEQLVSPKAITAVFNHLAFEALLFVPFSLFHFRTAYFLWIGVNISLLICCFTFLRRYYEPLRSIWSFLPAAMFACFFPFAFTIIEGQDSIVLTTLMAGAVLLMEKRSHYLAGVVLAAGLFKFQLVLPIVALAAVWRKWKIVYGFLMGALLVVCMSLAIVGVSSVRTYSDYLLALSSADQQVYGVQPLFMANLRGLFSGLTESTLGHGTSQILTIFASVALFLWACRQKASISVAITTSILVSYHCLHHDLSLLVIPLVLAPYEEKFSGTIWLWAAVLFAAPGVTFAWGIPSWVVAIPMIIFLWQIAQRNGHLSSYAHRAAGTVS